MEAERFYDLVRVPEVMESRLAILLFRQRVVLLFANVILYLVVNLKFLFSYLQVVANSYSSEVFYYLKHDPFISGTLKDAVIQG